MKIALLVLFGCAVVYGQQPLTCDPTLKPAVGGVCLPSVKASCVNACALRCGNDGECIFGCEVGQDYVTDRCYTDCNGFNPRCLDSCLQTIDCISRDCASLNKFFKIIAGSIVYNRSTRFWTQTIQFINLSCTRVENLTFSPLALATGWKLANADSGPNGTFRSFGAINPLATGSVTLQFTRTGTTTLSYSPQIQGDVIPAP